MGQGGRVPPIFGLGGQYYECPPQYYKSNIGYFSSMLHVLDRCFSLEVDLVISFHGPAVLCYTAVMALPSSAF